MNDLIHRNSVFQEYGTPEKHFSYVWKNVIEKANARKIFVVAHSYGGYLVVDYVSSFVVTVVKSRDSNSHHYRSLYCHDV